MKTLRFRGLFTALLIIASTVTLAIAYAGSGIVVDRRGYVYFVDTGSGVWMIDPRGKLTRHDGPRFHWMAIDESERPFGARLPSIPSGEVSAVGINPTLRTGRQKSVEGLVVTPVIKARTVIGAVGLQPQEWSCSSQSTSVELARFG